MRQRGIASLHTNKFALLDVEDGVETRVPDDPVAANADDDDDECVCVGCVRKDGESLLVPRNANVLSTHASGGPRKDVQTSNTSVLG